LPPNVDVRLLLNDGTDPLEQRQDEEPPDPFRRRRSLSR
jgi:hypothetical protein